MNAQQAYEAFRELANTSPPWIGSKVDHQRNVIIRACMHCGTREERLLPMPIAELATMASVPDGLDEQLFAWMKGFADKHRGCSRVATP